MALLADVHERSRFSLTYSDVLELPVSLRDRMLEEIDQWRAEEDSKARQSR